MFAEISALSNKEGHCWATNGYFAKIYGVTKETVSRTVNILERAGYVTIEMEYDGKEIVKRIIKIVDTPIDNNVNPPIEQNVKDNTINSNIININNRTKEQFEVFWKNIKSRKINKKRAWNYYCKIDTKLDDLQLAQKYNSLIDNTKDLKYVPHPERWIRDERWNDEETFSNHYGSEKIYRDEEGYIVSKEKYEELGYDK
jgi:DNA-binding transcriptional regulator YhcF (GntR family)